MGPHVGQLVIPTRHPAYNRPKPLLCIILCAWYSFGLNTPDPMRSIEAYKDESDHEGSGTTLLSLDRL
jgi:hypothetical protein